MYNKSWVNLRFVSCSIPPHFSFLTVTCIPPSEILTKSFVTLFFTFSFITLMSSLPNPQSKAFSIILVSNRKPSTVFHQLTSRIPLSFFSTIYIQCFTIDIINFSLLLTHSLHFRLVRILLLFQNFYIIFFLPLFQRTSDVSESEMPRTKYLTMSM